MNIMRRLQLVFVVLYFMCLATASEGIAQVKISLENMSERCVLTLYSFESKTWLKPILLEKSAVVEIELGSSQNYHARINYADGLSRDISALNFQDAIKNRKRPSDQTPKFVLETVLSKSESSVTTSYYKKTPVPVVNNGVATIEEQLIWTTESGTRSQYTKFSYFSLREANKLWVMPCKQPIYVELPKLEDDAYRMLGITLYP